MLLGNGEMCSWVSIADEATSTALLIVVLVEAKATLVSQYDMLQAVNRCFEAEGLPMCIKIDNGLPLVLPHTTDLPTLTVLWWSGLGIKVILNKPGCPQQNGTVEGLQRICFNWANSKDSKSVEEFQKSVDHARYIQRNVYHIKGKKTRSEIFPELKLNPRKYNIEDFDFNKVCLFLALNVWERLVSKDGDIKFNARKLFVSRDYIGQKVTVTFDPVARHWLIRANNGTLINKSSKGVPTKETILYFVKTGQVNEEQITDV
jgi:hypothetical protein